MNTVIIFAFSFVTLPLYRLIDVWAFIPLFIIPSTLSLIYLAMEMPETRGREIHEIVEQLVRDSGMKPCLDGGDVSVLPDVLPRQNSTVIGRFKESLRKLSNKISGNSMTLPRIIVKSESNTTLKTLTAAARAGSMMDPNAAAADGGQNGGDVAALADSLTNKLNGDGKDGSKGRFTSIVKVDI